ncbi:MAG: hypothetical protein HQL16_04040 [Candidatus Omnitrophica bacterium]|nr:hypothetical protein [Candidatus Omnitrophota bacterium]
MKKILAFILAGLFLLVQTQTAFAVSATKTFGVSATVPLATGITINASSVNSTTHAFTAVTGTALGFEPLAFNNTNSIWLPDHYFAIDVGTSGGAGVPTVIVTYVEGTNPNGTGHGLGWKSTLTFVKVVGTTETVLAAHGKKMLKDLSGETVASTELTGAYLRMYLGVVAKDPAAIPLDPATSEPFTNADAAGSYTGSLTVSATVV